MFLWQCLDHVGTFLSSLSFFPSLSLSLSFFLFFSVSEQDFFHAHPRSEEGCVCVCVFHVTAGRKERERKTQCGKSSAERSKKKKLCDCIIPPFSFYATAAARMGEDKREGGVGRGEKRAGATRSTHSALELNASRRFIRTRSERWPEQSADTGVTRHEPIAALATCPTWLARRATCVMPLATRPAMSGSMSAHQNFFHMLRVGRVTSQLWQEREHLAG